VGPGSRWPQRVFDALMARLAGTTEIVARARAITVARAHFFSCQTARSSPLEIPRSIGFVIPKSPATVSMLRVSQSGSRCVLLRYIFSREDLLRCILVCSSPVGRAKALARPGDIARLLVRRAHGSDSLHQPVGTVLRRASGEAVHVARTFAHPTKPV